MSVTLGAAAGQSDRIACDQFGQGAEVIGSRRKRMIDGGVVCPPFLVFRRDDATIGSGRFGLRWALGYDSQDTISAPDLSGTSSFRTKVAGNG